MASGSADGIGSISLSDWLIMGTIAIVALLIIKPILATTRGVGGAGRATGSFIEGVSDFTGEEIGEGSVDIARGTGDVVSDSMDFTLGGTADIIKAPGNMARDAYGGTMDFMRGL